MKTLTEKEYDDLRLVLVCLKVECQHVKKKAEAIEIISNKLDLPKEKVIEYLDRILGN